MKYWDTSAIAALLTQERDSAKRMKIVENDPVIITWWATRTECISALSREMRNRRLSVEDYSAAGHRLEILAQSWREILPSQEVRRLAERLLRVHPLRSADAFQLSAALIACDQNPGGFEFVCADKRLNEAALKEGFTIL